MADVLAEAYELVEDRLITEADLRDFLYTNPASFFCTVNPDFFKGTVVESAAAKLIGASSIAAPAPSK